MSITVLVILAIERKKEMNRSNCISYKGFTTLPFVGAYNVRIELYISELISNNGRICSFAMTFIGLILINLIIKGLGYMYNFWQVLD